MVVLDILRSYDVGGQVEADQREEHALSVQVHTEPQLLGYTAVVLVVERKLLFRL